MERNQWQPDKSNQTCFGSLTDQRVLLYSTLLYFTLAFAGQMTGQSVSITTCPGEVEVGIAASFKADFNSGGVSDITVVRYEWQADWNGDGDSGESGIEGNTNGETTVTTPYHHETGATSSTITITWGDFYNLCEDYVSVVAVYKVGGGAEQYTDPANCTVTVNCVLQPLISGPAEVQECCNDIIEYCDTSPGAHQDTWEWEVTGGTIVGDDDTKCISVIPDATGTITISTVASRSSGLAAYTRSNSENISRYQPVTPEIEGLDFLCLEESTLYCVDEICGSTSIDWIYLAAGSFTVQEVPGNPYCVELIPTENFPLNTVATINAQAVLNGGCTSTYSTINVTIFSSANPPCPDGYVVFELPQDFDPCEGGLYVIEYITSKPYADGITTVDPETVLDVPHHHIEEYVDVTVCNINLCSKVECCEVFRLYFPDCPDDPVQTIEDDFNNEISGTDEKFLNRDRLEDLVQDDQCSITIFPVPSNDFISLQSNCNGSGTINILDLSGRILLREHTTEISGSTFDISLLDSNTIYWITVESNVSFYMSSFFVYE